MPRFSLGQATLTVVNAGDIQYDLADSLKLAEADWPDTYRADFGRLIHIPQQTVVVQCGAVTAVIDIGHPRMPPGCEEYAIPAYDPPPEVPISMDRLGIPAQRVTHVIITHSHFDHYDGLCDAHGRPNFPHARHFLGHADWESESIQRALGDPDSLASRTLGVVQRLGLLELVDGDRHLDIDADIDIDIDIIAAPGETKGHQLVRVASQGQTLYCIGDLVHHAVELVHPGLKPYWVDAGTLRLSRDRFITSALREDARIVAGHIRGVGRLIRAEAGVRWQQVPVE